MTHCGFTGGCVCVGLFLGLVQWYWHVDFAVFGQSQAIRFPPVSSPHDKLI